ncbi:MAG TPA: type II toxin-antitoxin system VapC family toxin [Rhizomicrobium sp.]
MLDTNFVSDLARNPRAATAQHFRRVGQSDIGTSIVVASELRYGMARQGSTAPSRRIEEILQRLFVAPLEHPTDLYYGEIRALLEAAGTPIGYNDTLIAAHAIALGCVLVTDNESEFSRVPGLSVENWRR